MIRRILFGTLLTAALAAPLGTPIGPAAAQQYWTRPGIDGGAFNNPNRTMLDTANERMLQQHMSNRHNGGGTSAAAAPGAARAVQGGDPSFRLTNRDAAVMREVYVSSATDSGWGADRLGRDVLPSGRQVVIRLPQGQCVNDIRVVFADGRATERRRIDTCALTDIVIP
jgi:hypothetical protein